MAKGQKKSKAQYRDELERKRDERSRKSAVKRERRTKEAISEYLEEDANFVSLSNQLQIQGLKIKQIKGDGNCLFRALADQLDGEPEVHGLHRSDTVKYMRNHRQDFEPFVDKPYDKYMDELAETGTFGGNDAIVAFARNNGVDIVIHQLNEPRWVINGSQYSKSGRVIELHLSYHNGDHYSSVRATSDPDSGGPAWPYHNHHAAPGSANRGKTDKGKESQKMNKKHSKQKHVNKSCSAAQTSSDSGSLSSSESTNDMESIVMATTGCKDHLLVTQALEENMYDIDCTVNYVLQMMSLTNELDISNESSNSEETFSGETNKTEHQTEPCSVDVLRGCKECECRNSATDSPSGTIDISTFNPTKFAEDLKENLNKTGGGKKKGGGKNIQPIEYLSNRKRKELAKKERKKRREETRRQAVQSHPHDHTENSSTSELVTDLGELRI